MAERLRENERLVCIGQTALRAPDGTPLKAVPMYIKVNASDVNPEDDMTDGERKLIADVGGLFAEKMKAYIQGSKMRA